MTHETSCPQAITYSLISEAGLPDAKLEEIVHQMYFVHAYENASDLEKEHMYICDDCKTWGVRHVFPTHCPACGSTHVKDAAAFLIDIVA